MTSNQTRMVAMGRMVGALLGSAVIFALYAVLLPIAVMVVGLYLVRFFPLTGRRRRRLTARWRKRNSG